MRECKSVETVSLFFSKIFLPKRFLIEPILVVTLCVPVSWQMSSQGLICADSKALPCVCPDRCKFTLQPPAVHLQMDPINTRFYLHSYADRVTSDQNVFSAAKKQIKSGVLINTFFGCFCQKIYKNERFCF